MSEGGAAELLAEGAAALDRGDWDGARASFDGSLSVAEDPAAHDGLARALWWLGLPEEAIEHRERAFVLYKSSGETRRAAGLAIWLAKEHGAVHGDEAVANGWLARAEGLLRGEHCAESGWLELARARTEDEAPVRAAHAENALEAARSFADPDLEVASLAELGLAAIELGRVEEGLDHLDEAMAAATAGEVELLDTVGEACCALVAACELAGDAGRLEQWARIVGRFLERRGEHSLLGFCRTCNAELLAASGSPKEAERELLGSVAELRAEGHRSRCVDPAVKLAEVRILQGRLEEADALLEGRQGLPEAALPVAELLWLRGEHSLAISRLIRRLDQVGEDGLLGAPLLSRLVQILVAKGDLDTAQEMLGRLASAAESTGHPLIVSLARLSRGRLATARGDTAEADLAFAADRLEKLGHPLESARARLDLAEALKNGQAEVAADEARRALAAFEAAGARRDADRAAALLRALGVRGRTGPKELDLLTRREREVLALLAQGLSNAEIAARLYVSTKTAGHHVSSILAKLHVKSRGEAAALAFRSDDAFGPNQAPR